MASVNINALLVIINKDIQFIFNPIHLIQLFIYIEIAIQKKNPSYEGFFLMIYQSVILQLQICQGYFAFQLSSLQYNCLLTM